MQRKWTFLLFIVFSISFLGQSQAQNLQAFYAINLGNYVNAKQSNFSKLMSLGMIYSQNTGNGLQTIYLGGYDNKPAADKVLKQAKAKGYDDAFVQQRVLPAKNAPAVIQLGIQRGNEKIDWDRYAKAGPVYLLFEKNMVKVVTGKYTTLSEAKKALPAIRKRGFSDAFAKLANKGMLLKAGPFETGGQRIQEANLPSAYEAAATSQSNTPKSYEIATTDQSTPSSYDIVVPASSDPIGVSNASQPNINGKVKRQSVMDLQRVLQKEKAYKGGIDGYYGNNTSKAFYTAKASNQQVLKYQVLSKEMPPDLPTKEPSALDFHIQSLAYDPETALRGLESSRQPIAKAYRAYYLFATGADQAATNQLMNDALRSAFSTSAAKSKVPSFDANAYYAYNNIEQLLRHIRIIQRVSTPEPNAPCWLFERHPKEARLIYEPGSSFSQVNYNIEPCDQFMNWEDIRLLQVIAADMNSSQLNRQRVLDGLIARTRIYVTPKPMTKDQAEALESWNKRLWISLDGLAKQNALYARTVTPLKLTFFQSQVLLEDHFMAQGFSKYQARSMALFTLNTIISPYLESYLR